MATETGQKKKVDSGRIYRERISFLMSKEQQQVFSIYMDVTDGILLDLVADGNSWDEEELEKTDVFQWLMEKIYPEIVYEESKNEFREIFQKEYLLKAFREGKHYQKCRHAYWSKNKMILVYEMRINMFLNPDTDHIEACVIWRDSTENYMDKEIQRILYRKDYELLGLINIETGKFYIRSCQIRELQDKKGREFLYEDIREILQKKRIAERSQEQFLHCTALDYLKDAMNLAGQFSFNVYDYQEKVERYSYYWFDRKRHILLVAIDDMTKEAETDPVTGAWNREGFCRKTKEILENHPDQSFVLLYINIQRFKAVNDLFGYENGDRILKEVVRLLQASFLRPLVVGRVESDRFTVLTHTKNLKLSRMTDFLHQVYEKGDLRIDLYGRCGIYYVPQNSTLDVSEMCDRAKLAKSSIKNQYVQPYAVYQEEMLQDYEQKSIALIHLDDAVENNEIQVYYQPIYDAWSEKIVSAEALARWNSPERGVILPGNFVPVLEESGRITKLDTFIYENVRAFLKERLEKELPTVRVSMTLSRMDLMDPVIMETIRKGVRHSGLPKEAISFELTESAYATLSDSGIAFLSDLHKAGISTLLDDFGSGVSSFSTLRDYDFDIVKLDMGFVRKLGENKKISQILISVVELVHRLDMKVVAEGVETREQAELLKNYGCDYFQGYYYSRPIPQKEFEELLDRQ